MNGPVRARRASTSGYAVTIGRGKLTRECPKCGAKIGWHCRMTKNMGDGVTNWTQLKHPHKER